MREEKVQYKKILRDAGLKSTGPRLTILEVLSKLKHPTTAQELHLRLKKNDLDLVTLYRTLASFKEHGLVRIVDLHKDAVYYELETDHHHHLICTSCNTIEDFEDKEIEKSFKQIAKKSSHFENIQEHSLELFGLCKKCAQL